jgi:predicted transcriptional regulator
MGLQGFVRDYMIIDVFTVKPEDDVLETINIIVKGVDQLPVVDDEGQLVGMVTWQDVSEKVILKSQNPKKVKVQKIMETKTIKLSPRDPIRKALSLLTSRKFSLPVVENKKFIGLLSFMDILRSYLDAVSTSTDKDAVH